MWYHHLLLLFWSSVISVIWQQGRRLVDHRVQNHYTGNLFAKFSKFRSQSTKSLVNVVRAQKYCWILSVHCFESLTRPRFSWQWPMLILQSHFSQVLEIQTKEYRAVYQIIKFVRILNYHGIQILHGNNHFINSTRTQTFLLFQNFWFNNSPEWYLWSAVSFLSFCFFFLFSSFLFEYLWRDNCDIYGSCNNF